MGKSAKSSKGSSQKTAEEPAETEEEKAETISALLGEIFVQVDAGIYENELKRKEVPFTVNYVLNTLQTILSLYHSQPEQCTSAEELERAAIAASQEPTPAPIDSCATGVVPTKVVELSTKIDAFESINGEGSRLPSESGRSKATRSVRSKTYRSVGSKKSQGRDGSGAQRKRGKLPGYIIPIEEDDPFEHYRRAREPVKLREQEAAEEEEEAPGTVEEDIAGKQALEEAARVEAERQRKLAKELDGKNYAIDHKGNVIIVKTPHGDKLPKNCIEPEHELKAVEVARGDMHREAEAEGSSQAEQSKEDRQETDANNRYYKSAVSFQQQILKNPALQIEAGVHIKEGGLGRAGPKRTEDARQMSRERFLAHQSLLESQTGQSIGMPSFAATTVENTTEQVSRPAENESKLRADEDTDLSEDPNVALVQSADWGKNPATKSFLPAVLPAHKPSKTKARAVKSHRLRTQVGSASKNRRNYNLAQPRAPSTESSFSEQPSLLNASSSALKSRPNGKVTFKSNSGRNVLGIGTNTEENEAVVT